MSCKTPLFLWRKFAKDQRERGKDGVWDGPLRLSSSDLPVSALFQFQLNPASGNVFLYRISGTRGPNGGEITFTLAGRVLNFLITTPSVSSLGACR